MWKLRHREASWYILGHSVFHGANLTGFNQLCHRATVAKSLPHSIPNIRR